MIFFVVLPEDFVDSILMMDTCCCWPLAPLGGGDVTEAPLRLRRLRHWSQMTTPISAAVTSDAATITPTNSPVDKNK